MLKTLTFSITPATFLDLATIPVTSLPGCDHMTLSVFLPSYSESYDTESTTDNIYIYILDSKVASNTI